jgi:hypothetical protein
MSELVRIELEERLKRLEDLEEIRALYIDYGRYLDSSEVAPYAMLFARDAKLRYGPVMRADNREEVAQAAAKVMQPASDATRRTVHLLASPSIALNGDTATGECVWAAVSASEAGPRMLFGRHIDELVREDGRWCFAKRRGLVDVGTLG